MKRPFYKHSYHVFQRHFLRKALSEVHFIEISWWKIIFPVRKIYFLSWKNQISYSSTFGLGKVNKFQFRLKTIIFSLVPHQHIYHFFHYKYLIINQNIESTELLLKKKIVWNRALTPKFRSYRPISSKFYLQKSNKIIIFAPKLLNRVTH